MNRRSFIGSVSALFSSLFVPRAQSAVTQIDCPKAFLFGPGDEDYSVEVNEPFPGAFLVPGKVCAGTLLILNGEFFRVTWRIGPQLVMATLVPDYGWRDVADHLKSDLTDEEYDSMWDEFREMKAKRSMH